MASESKQGVCGGTMACKRVAMPEPLVSIVLPTYNSSATLRAALMSVQMQTLKEWELLVVDDGSTDNTVSIVTGLSDERIRLLTGRSNRGIAHALNKGIALCRAPVIARMDADDICFPDRLQKQFDFLVANPSIDLVGSGMMIFKDSGTPLGVFPVKERHEEICARPWQGFYLPHPTWMGRREWFMNNPYDENARKAQDQSLLLQTHRTSRFAAIPQPLLGYRQDAVSLQKSFAGRQIFALSLLRYYLATGRPDLAVRGVAGQMVKLCADVMVLHMGIGRSLLAHRAGKPTHDQELLNRWKILWESVSQVELKGSSPCVE